jgi:hypothetical protein
MWTLFLRVGNFVLLSTVSFSVFTIVSKLIIKYVWECRNKKFLPTEENRKAFLYNKIINIKNNNRKFRNLWNMAAFTVPIDHP